MFCGPCFVKENRKMMIFILEKVTICSIVTRMIIILKKERKLRGGVMK